MPELSYWQDEKCPVCNEAPVESAKGRLEVKHDYSIHAAWKVAPAMTNQLGILVHTERRPLVAPKVLEPSY